MRVRCLEGMIKINEDTSLTLRSPIVPQQYIVVRHVTVQDPDVIADEPLVSWYMSAEGGGWGEIWHVPAIVSRRAHSS